MSVKKRVLFFSIFVLFISEWTATAQAQWKTEVVQLSPGWNSVFLHVDPSHLSLNEWIGSDPDSPILQIWRWNAGETAQFVDSPQQPILDSTGWESWNRNDPDSSLQKLFANTAYLVEVSSSYEWRIKGKPKLPAYSWSMNGLNLIGFPVDPDQPPYFGDFIDDIFDIDTTGLDIYQYEGTSLSDDNLGEVEKIPDSLFRIVPVKRGRAYWLKAEGQFNRVFSPFEVVLVSSDGANFYDTLNTSRFRLRNHTNSELSVSMTLLPSESVPEGETSISGVPPLLVRGPRDFEQLDFSYDELLQGVEHSQTWTLEPRGEEGSEVEVVLGLDRSAISQDVGSLLSGILRFTDSQGFTQIDMSTSAEVDSDKGLWVGEALVTEVSTDSGEVLGEVPSWFPLRLIVHDPLSGNPKLLQQVYHGKSIFSNQVLSLHQELLDPAHFESARRITATHLPWSQENVGWELDGTLDPGSVASVTVTTAYDDHRSNPFLHKYHPDHDNLDVFFDEEPLPQGFESYELVRTIRLHFDTPGTDFSSRIRGGQVLLGEYQETIQLIGQNRGAVGNDTRGFEVRGAFRLDRVSDIPLLTEAP